MRHIPHEIASVETGRIGLIQKPINSDLAIHVSIGDNWYIRRVIIEQEMMCSLLATTAICMNILGRHMDLFPVPILICTMGDMWTINFDSRAILAIWNSYNHSGVFPTANFLGRRC